MTKEEIIKAIWNQSPDLTLQKAKLVYENTMNLVMDALARGESVEIRIRKVHCPGEKSEGRKKSQEWRGTSGVSMNPLPSATCWVRIRYLATNGDDGTKNA